MSLTLAINLCWSFVTCGLITGIVWFGWRMYLVVREVPAPRVVKKPNVHSPELCKVLHGMHFLASAETPGNTQLEIRRQRI